MKFRDGDSLLSMSVIRAAQMAAEEQAEDDAAVEEAAETPASPYFGLHPQYVFTITDGGFAKRTRITEYRVQSRGGLGIKAMSLANEERGSLVGAFIVERGTRSSRSPRAVRSCAARSTPTSAPPGARRWA